MTDLRGKIERATPLTHRGRAIVVGFEAPGYITIRLKGTQQVERESAVLLYELLVKRRVDAEIQAKRSPGKRRVKRGLL